MSSDNSITFRSFSLEKDDHCKTIIKIEPEYMEKLGINEGDIVQITGTDKAFAFCFSATSQEIEKTKSQEIPIEYLNPSHKENVYPKMILSGLVASNACPSNRMRLVKLEKLTENFKDTIPEANVITLGTMEFAEKTMPKYKDNIDFSSLFGRLVKKKERISTSFLQDFAHKHQQTSRGGHSHPPKFSSLIVDAKPENKEFWIITKNTKFEFQNVSMSEFRGKAPKPESLSLLRVIPIVEKLHLHDTDIAFSSLEVFENNMKLSWYTHQRTKLPDYLLSNPSKFNDMNMRVDSPELTIQIKDDLGNVHSDGHSGGGGGSSGPDPTTNEMVSDYSGEFRFFSTLDSNAKEITIIINEIAWVKRERLKDPPPSIPPNMGTLSESNPKLSVLEGPWEFKITL
ncbi:hypothetical protein [Nitrosopumilus adriaticus]|uniref:Uncharacterized protein n=1 Tax=Nitrosopumilus adriaticus TaxID=1580092 RepID=A0A0D5C1C1_9ARCH|nr:hypothetical protein [Nitrosopumilus adriaticus]AJW70343.1 hypothetical protein NADRNF5_0647 [Nitrosopumilus adriaticus]